MKNKTITFRCTFQIICTFILIQMFDIVTFAQNDTLFIHISETVDFYPLNDIDSLTFHQGSQTTEDSIFLWSGPFVLSKYQVTAIDSLSFNNFETIHQPLIAFCSGIPFFTDLRDQMVYRTVKIGNQCWLRENLRYLPAIYQPNSTSTSEPRYYVYDYLGNSILDAYLSLNYQLYGVLYNWKAATQVCPKGWRLPNNDDWDSLQFYLISNLYNYDESTNDNKIAKALSGSMPQQQNGLWSNSLIPGTPGDFTFELKRNLSGFSGIPAGYLNASQFSNVNMQTFFWSNSDSSENLSVSKYISYDNIALNNILMLKDNGLSVRCISERLQVYTDSVTGLLHNKATLNGRIVVGPEPIVQKGFYWKKVIDSTWNIEIIPNEQFSREILNLDSNTTYHFFAFAKSINDTLYGDTIAFMTEYILPVPKIPYVFFVNYNSAIIKTSVTPGTIPNFYYWFRYKDVDSLNWNYSYHVGYQNMDSLYNLVTNHSYMLQLVLVCGNDTIYSPIQHFVTTKTTPCPGLQTYTDPRDGNIYNTVFINNTCWLKENLRYLPSVASSSTISNTVPYYYVYNYNDTNVTNAKNTLEYQTTGVLYNWPATMNGEQSYNQTPSIVQGACPPGWQVPSLSEWSKLRNFLTQDTSYYISICGSGSVAKALSGSAPVSQGGLWGDVNSNCSAGDTTYYYKRNLTGMTFLPGGFLNYHTFSSYNYGTVFWSSSNAIQTYANGCQISYIDPSFITSMVTMDSKTGASLRCVKQASPIIKNINVSNILIDQVTINGQIISGIDSILTKGIKIKALNETIWNTIYLSNDSISEIINGLDTSMTYEYFIFAFTNNDSTYSSIFQFQTLGLNPCPEAPFLIDSRDNTIYSTVKIGNQCWTRENLRYLPTVYHPDSISNMDLRYYVYGFNQNNLALAQQDSSYIKFGALYNYKSIKDACPEGWHIPKINEWDSLKDQLVKNGYNYNQQFFGNKIAKSLSGSNAISNGGMWANSQNIGAPGNTDFPNFRNVSFFNFLPSGYYQNSCFKGKDSVSGYWIANIPTDTTYKAVNLYFECDSLKKITTNPENGWYARCLKNINTIININFVEITYNQIAITTSIIPGNDYLINYCIKVKPLNSDQWPIIQTYDPISQYIFVTSLQPDISYQMIVEMRTDRDTLNSDTITFSTPPLPPSFSDIIFSNKEINSIKINAVINSGSSAVIEKGFQYKQVDSITWNTIYINSDTISMDLNGLVQKQKYNLRFFVHDVDSISYSADTVFSTLWNPPCPNLPSFYDLRDSNSYRTIQIGNQCWMRENLRYLPEVYFGNINSSDSARFYVTEYDGSSVIDAKNSINYSLYGVLYNGIAAKNGYISDTFVPITNQGICPIGWHLPSKAEFDTLFKYLKINGYACSGLTTDNQIVKSLVSSQPQSIGGLWLNSSSIIAPGNVKYQEIRNNSGFSLLPCGTKNDYGFLSIGYLGSLWTGSIHVVGGNYGYYTINSNSATPIYNSMNPKGTCNVRCVKN